MAADHMKVDKGMTINGRLRANGDLTIDGFVEGRVSAEGKVRVNRTGVVRADIVAEAALIAGSVVGNVTATDGVEIATGGRLEGDITAPKVLLREGAAFLGQVAMGPVVATSMSVPTVQDERSDASALPAPRPAFEPVAAPVREAESVPAGRRTVDTEAEEVTPPPGPGKRTATHKAASQRAPDPVPEPSPDPTDPPGSNDLHRRRVKVKRKV